MIESLSSRRGAVYVADILRSDPERWTLLGHVADLSSADAGIAAGFVRTSVWDALYGRPPQRMSEGIAVVWFDAGGLAAERDREIEARLRARMPDADWSVKNQARMHVRNTDFPGERPSAARGSLAELAAVVR